MKGKKPARIKSGGQVKAGHRTIGYQSAPLSPKSRWLTTLLSLFFGGLLFLIIMAVWFKGNLQ